MPSKWVSVAIVNWENTWYMHFGRVLRVEWEQPVESQFQAVTVHVSESGGIVDAISRNDLKLMQRGEITRLMKGGA